MQYSIKVDKTEESLTSVLNLVSRIEEDRVFSAIISKRLSHDDLVEYSSHLKEIRQRQLREIGRLKKFAKDFNKQYATDDNKCFSTSQLLFNQIRSNMKETLKLFKTFCPRINSRGPVVDGEEIKPSVLTHSMLGATDYTPEIFGPAEGCDPVVADFIKEFGFFILDVQNALSMCEDVIHEESDIRNDTARCINLYNQCCEEVLVSSKEFIDYFGEDGFKKEDEMSRNMSHAPSINSFIQENLHCHNLNQFRIHVWHKTYTEAKVDRLNDIESYLWPTDHQKALDARIVTAHFDELEPKGKLDKKTACHKLSGDYVAVFMQWCGINQSFKENKFIEMYFAESYSGRYQKIAYSTVNSAKSRLLRDTQRVEQIREKIDSLLAKYKS